MMAALASNNDKNADCPSPPASAFKVRFEAFLQLFKIQFANLCSDCFWHLELVVMPTPLPKETCKAPTSEGHGRTRAHKIVNLILHRLCFSSLPSLLAFALSFAFCLDCFAFVDVNLELSVLDVLQFEC